MREVKVRFSESDLEILDNLAKENGMIVRAMGDSVGFTPPLIIKPAEIDQMMPLLI